MIRTVPIPIAVDLGATFVFSITGAISAIRKHYDPVGLFFLAMACALGGALIRDGLFIQQGPPAVMKDGRYLLMVVAGCLVAWLFHRQVRRLDKPFLLLDALGTGAYGVFGASKAYEAGLAVAACLFVGTLTAVGGGVIRDVLVREEPLVFKPGQFYLLAAFAGVGAFALAGDFLALPLLLAAGIGIGVTFLIRFLSIHFGWKTVAVLPPPGGPGPPR